MKNFLLLHWISLSIIIIISLTSCAEDTSGTLTKDSPDPITTTDETPVVNVAANIFLESNGTIEKSDNKVIIEGDEAWLSYEIDVPVAGRYQFSIEAAAAADGVSIWVEDYINNKDDRNYNITGSIPLPTGTDMASVGVDGSPLNQGKHPIKVHVKGGKASIKGFSFELIRAHQKTPITLTQKTDGKEWKVVWSDEFDGSGIPDTSKWTFDIGNWGWGNNELQYYTEARPENARIENGNLIIEARKNDMGQKWTSARLTTRGKETFLYGRIEFRAKVPVNKGNWAAGWTLGDDYVDEISWPYCGEIDIMESVGYEMDNETGNGKAHASVHCGAYYFKLNNHHTSTIDVKNMNDDFHIYAVDWTPEGITAWVDDQAYFTYNDTSNELTWPFDKPQNIILNLAMGGGWGGAQGMDDSMTSQKLILDYVRVYEKQ